jgi:restriction system protein
VNTATNEFIDVRAMPLEEWLALVFNPPEGKVFTNCHFPTEEHLKEYLETIDRRSEEEVRSLLVRFLVHSGTVPMDEIKFQSFISARSEMPELFDNMSKLFYDKRLLLHYTGRKEVPPWEGITWVMDLLPHFPERAAEAIFAYFLAHAGHLTDAFIHRLHDAGEVIRAKFIGLPKKQSDNINLLLNQGPRSFECLVERLYFHMGYDTTLTPPTKDGGRGIICKRQAVGRKEHLLVECKLYTGSIGVSIVSSLLGVISDEKSNKGAVVTSSRFTRGAKQFAQRNPRLELIDGDSLIPLMNEHIGPRWPLQIDRLVAEASGVLKSKRKDKDLR